VFKRLYILGLSTWPEKVTKDLKSCKLNDDDDDNGIMDEEKARRIMKTDPFMPTPGSDPRAWLVGLNFAHNSTMTLQSDGLFFH
jgi:hypothetical protein